MVKVEGLTQKATRLATELRRRARDPQVIELCDLVFALVAKQSAGSDGVEPTSVQHPPGLVEKAVGAITSGGLKGFDKRAYQREYMRRRRAEGKK